MSKYATVLFDLFDDELDRHARNIRRRVFSEYRDIPWKHEQYQRLQPLLRQELNDLLYSILGIFDNVGAVIPEEAQVLGYRIKALPYQEVAAGTGLSTNNENDEEDIHFENEDYCDMWLRYLADKTSSSSSNSVQQEVDL